jgi:N-methylhydantoinase A
MGKAPRQKVRRKATGVKVGVDIGGTFTDIAVEAGGRLWSAKVSTTPVAPHEAVLTGVTSALESAGLSMADVDLLVHGTTLATNALIERRGARTALLTTEGFRDVLEMGNEGRFDQYDIRATKPIPIIPREWRFTVPERLRADGTVERPLDEEALRAIGKVLRDEKIESLAIGFLHSYIDGVHERRAAALLKKMLPDLSISVSHEVSPQMREYERFSTVCLNAYIQPVMGGYLDTLQGKLKALGLRAPMMLILSSGSLCTIETAIRFPIRLVESGPAGGAIFASTIARAIGRGNVLSFDLGGTTAKFCLIDGGRARTSMGFEVARTYRFKRGSGLPVRIPVIDLVEIGAGGGSIARLDPVGRITVGPDSAGSEPGPACYGRGGPDPTVTDCDLVMGKIDPDRFAGGKIRLDVSLSHSALTRGVAQPTGLAADAAAFAVTETVAETMAAAARVHATECGTELRDRTMIAFGGAAPLHAARFAQRLGVKEVVVPIGASIGSAIGFLWAPVAYEIARSVNVLLGANSVSTIADVLAKAEKEARDVVVRAIGKARPLSIRSLAMMRYRGQGHEIEVPIPAGTVRKRDGQALEASFQAAYSRIYGRAVPQAPIEVTAITVTVSGAERRIQQVSTRASSSHVRANSTRRVFDPQLQAFSNWAVFERAALRPGSSSKGPAIIVEPDTTTVVPRGFSFRVDSRRYLILQQDKG